MNTTLELMVKKIAIYRDVRAALLRKGWEGPLVSLTDQFSRTVEIEHWRSYERRTWGRGAK